MPYSWICLGYLVAYFGAGVFAKLIPMNGVSYPMHSLLGSNLFCLAVVGLSLWKPRALLSMRLKKVAITCGVCVAVIAFTSVYFFTLPISIASAMAILSCLMLIAGWSVDLTIYFTGKSGHPPSRTETLSVVLAIMAIAMNCGELKSLPWLMILPLLTAYTGTYFLRLYLQRTTKLSLREGEEWEPWAIYRYEQISTSICTLTVVGYYFSQPDQFVRPLAAASGCAGGMAGIFSAMIFLWPTKSATHKVVINRTLYLGAGTLASLYLAASHGLLAFTPAQIWSLLFSLAAVGLLGLGHYNPYRKSPLLSCNS